MLKIKDLLFIYLLRLPFFFLVYTITIVMSGFYEGILLPLLVVYLLISTLNTLFSRFALWISVICTIIAILFLLDRMAGMTFAFLGFSMYRPEEYYRGSNIALISIIFIFMVITTLFIDASYIFIFIRNLVISTVAIVMARQEQTLDRFLVSYYCRGVSRKTLSMVIKRCFIFTVACLVLIVALGFMVHPQGSIVQFNSNNRTEGTGWDSGMTSGTDNPDSMELDGEDVEQGDVIGGSIMDETPNLSEEEKENFLNAFLTMLGVITVILVAVVVLLLMLYKNSNKEDYDFNDDDDIYEETPIIHEKSSKKRRRLPNPGVNYTIRKLFKKKVKEYIITKDFHPQKSDTPKMLANTISEWENITTLETLYQKARYSGEQLKRTDLTASKGSNET